MPYALISRTDFEGTAPVGALPGALVDALPGALVDALVDALPGALVDALVGALVDAPPDSLVGSLPGSPVGSLPGSPVGSPVGSLPGALVGAPLDAPVGAPVGAGTKAFGLRLDRFALDHLATRPPDHFLVILQSVRYIQYSELALPRSPSPLWGFAVVLRGIPPESCSAGTPAQVWVKSRCLPYRNSTTFDRAVRPDASRTRK